MMRMFSKFSIKQQYKFMNAIVSNSNLKGETSGD